MTRTEAIENLLTDAELLDGDRGGSDMHPSFKEGCIEALKALGVTDERSSRYDRDRTEVGRSRLDRVDAR